MQKSAIALDAASLK